MTKQEFLQELRDTLANQVTPESMMDSYRYYDSYIDECVRNGQSEEKVIETLGKPYLIARSIIAAQTGERTADVEYTEDGRTKKVRNKPNFGKQDSKEKVKREKREFHFNPLAWYAKVLYVLILLLVILCVFALLKGLIWIFLTFGIPILLVLGIVYLIMYFVNS